MFSPFLHSRLVVSSPSSSSAELVLTPRARVAVVLAGCGAKDGAEITESVALLIALSAQGMDAQVFAPDRPFAHVVNHRTGEAEPAETRNMLTEANRIARGKARALSELKADSFDAVAFAGGFGAAKNLCDFAFQGAAARLEPDAGAVIGDFLDSRKPIGALCIAPVLLALAARDRNVRGVRLTLGDGSAEDAVNAVTAWGATHVPTPVDKACIDSTHRMVTAPAYMYDNATSAGILASAEALVHGLRELLLAQASRKN